MQDPAEARGVIEALINVVEFMTLTPEMTHFGLTPLVECFESCEADWNFHVGQSLLRVVSVLRSQLRQVR